MRDDRLAAKVFFILCQKESKGLAELNVDPQEIWRMCSGCSGICCCGGDLLTVPALHDPSTDPRTEYIG